jgi:hypothetical protein
MDTLITNQKILNSNPPIIGAYKGQVMKNSNGQTVPHGPGEFWEYDKTNRFDRIKDKLILRGNWENGKWKESEDKNIIWDTRISNKDLVFEHDGYIGRGEDGIHSGLVGGKSKRKRKRRRNKKNNKRTKRNRKH